MASTPGRQRGSRPQVQNEIGTYGRTTGVVPPDARKVHRDSGGMEKPDDYFNRADRQSEDGESQQSEIIEAEEEESDSDELGRVGNNTSSRQSAKKSAKKPERGRDRPDKYIPGEGRGRKTGAVVAEGQRGDDGLEDPFEFFRNGNVSSPPGSVITTTQSTIGRTAQSSRTTTYHGSSRSQRTEYYEDDDEFEDTTRISPSKYQQRHQSQSQTQSQTISASVSTSAARKPSSLRHSILPSGSHSTSRKGLSSASKGRRSSPTPQYENEDSRSEEEPGFEEEEPDTERSSAQKKTPRRRFSSVVRQNGGEEDEPEEPIIQDYEIPSDASHDVETVGDRTIRGEVINEDPEEEQSSGDERSPEIVETAKRTSRKSMGKGGKVQAANKGKGKGKEVVELDEEIEQEEEVIVVEQSDDEEIQNTSSSARKSGKKPRQPRISDISTSSARRESRSSSAGLVKLGKNGKETPVVDRKGKGKEVDRSPSPRHHDDDDDVLDDNQHDEQYNDFNPEFGGGGNEEDEERLSPSQFHYDDDPDVEDPPAYNNEEPQQSEEEVEQQPEDEQERSSSEEQEEEEQPRASTSKSKSKEKAKPKPKPQKVVKPASSSKSRGKKRSSESDSDSDSSAATVTAKRARRVATPFQEGVMEIVPRDDDAGTFEDHGVRRSSRRRIQPLEYWRNERVVYKKRSADVVAMTAIVRVPKVDPEPLSHARSRKRSKSKSSAPRSRGSKRARSVKTESDTEDEEDRVDSMTDPDGLVWSWEGNAETTRRIAFTENMMDPKPAFNNQYQFQKIYQELDYLAGGILDIPVGGRKDTKPAKDNSYLFYCAKGSVSVLCHRTRVTIGRGGTFFIPRGNSYSIEATSNKPVRLFFAQGRRVIELEDGSTRPDTQEASQQVRDAQEQALREQEEAQDTGSEQQGSDQEEEEEEEQEEEEEE